MCATNEVGQEKKESDCLRHICQITAKIEVVTTLLHYIYYQMFSNLRPGPQKQHRTKILC